MDFGAGKSSKNPFATIIIGVAFFLGSFGVLFWNEIRAVKTARGLDEGAGIVITVSPDKINPINNMKLVHMTGELVTQETLTDDVFGVAVKNAVMLNRKAQIFQWKEKREKNGDKINYTYNKIWSDRLIDSADFHTRQGHENGASRKYESGVTIADKVTLGAFRLPESLIRKYGHFSRLALTGEDIQNSPETRRPGIKLQDGALYYSAHGATHQTARIGDEKIMFEVAKTGPASVIARQAGSTLSPYKTTSGGTINMLSAGNHSAESMFTAARTQNVIMTWVWRFVGFFMMLIGLTAIFSSVTMWLRAIPVAGALIQSGASIAGFLIAVSLTFVTISIAWIMARPLVGGGLLAVAAGALLFGGKLAGRQASTPPLPDTALPPLPDLDMGEPVLIAETDADQSANWKETIPEQPEPWLDDQYARFFVFVEGDGLAGEKIDNIIKTREGIDHRVSTAPRTTVVNFPSWPGSREELGKAVNKAIVKFIKTNPELPNYGDSSLFSLRMWNGKEKSSGKRITILTCLDRRAMP